MSPEKISTTSGLKAPPRRRKPQPHPDSLSLKGILINLFGTNYLHHTQALLTEHNISLSYQNIRTFISKNYLPDYIAPILNDYGRSYAQRILIQEAHILKLQIEYWLASREACIKYGTESLERLRLAGQNEKVTVGPWNGTFRPQKRLNPREALSRAASPGAHGQSGRDAPKGISTTELTPAPEPIADLLDAWFPPRRKNPPVKV